MSRSGALDPTKADRLEPQRMVSTRSELERRGWQVQDGPRPGESYRLESRGGIRFVFWPYTGWWQACGVAATHGRGFASMLKVEHRLAAEKAARQRP